MAKSVEVLPEKLPMNWDAYNAAGECGCIMCGKPMSKGKKIRYVHIGSGGASILRADLFLGGFEGEQAIFANGELDTGDRGWYAIGPDCARKLGYDYSKEIPPVKMDTLMPDEPNDEFA